MIIYALALLQSAPLLPPEIRAKQQAMMEADRAKNRIKLARMVEVEGANFMVRVRFNDGIAEANRQPGMFMIDDRLIRMSLRAIERLSGCTANFDRIEKTRVFAKLDCSVKPSEDFDQ